MRIILTALRTLKRFRLYTIVNAIGLAVSLGCVILIARYVHQELTVNHFVKDLNRTYITAIEEANGQARYSGVVAGQSNLLADPLIEKTTTFFAFEEDHVLLEDHKIDIKVLAADSLFLQILPYPVAYGTHRMITPEDAIITGQLANQLFGNENPVGKTLTYSSGEELTIVGVLGKPSSKSFLDFDMLINKDQRHFQAYMPYDLVMLHKGSDINQLNDRYSDYAQLPQIARREGRFQLVPLKDFYFDALRNIPSGLSRGAVDSVFIRGNSGPVYILAMVGILILLVGMFNFTNIYTVIILKREKEFGIKKILGVGRRTIFLQIYIENFLMTLVALFGGWLFIEIATPLLANRLAFSVHPNIRFDVWLSLLIIIGLPLIASLHPYWRYNRLLPGKLPPSRSLFLFLQYVITFGLFVAALFFIKQLNHMLNADTGYKTENVLITRMMQRNISMPFNRMTPDYFAKIDQNAAFVEQKMNESPLFTEWVFGRPVYDLEATTRIRRTGDADFQHVNLISISPAYFHMFGFQLKEGRLWDASDVEGQNKCILNESAQQLFGATDIRTTRLEMEHMIMREDPADDADNSYEVVGVIHDFQTGHLSKQTVPLVITYQAKGFHFDHLMARYGEGRKEDAIRYLEAIFQEVNSDADFTYSLLEESIDALYLEDRKVSRVYTLFALIAIFVSCLGLFALSLFDTRQRFREIALRKVNGAMTHDIMRLLLRRYVFLLGSAFVVAIPVTYMFIHRYLEAFAHKAPVSWWLFFVSAIVVASVSMLTLYWQVKRAVRINPADILKSEQ